MEDEEERQRERERIQKSRTEKTPWIVSRYWTDVALHVQMYERRASGSEETRARIKNDDDDDDDRRIHVIPR